MNQKNIKIGPYGEQYGNWMSNPVFYMLGGVIAAAALLALGNSAALVGRK